MKHILILAAGLLAAASTADARQSTSHRDPAQVHHFRSHYPCPSTGKTTGACPGYVVDHVHALCKGGADRPSNMQWQTKADAKTKDRWECKR